MLNLIQRSMPILDGKKVENITAKVNAQQKELFQEVCNKEDRPLSYVVRELALRGIAQYKRDGKLKITSDDERVLQGFANTTDTQWEQHFQDHQEKAEAVADYVSNQLRPSPHTEATGELNKQLEDAHREQQDTKKTG